MIIEKLKDLTNNISQSNLKVFLILTFFVTGVYFQSLSFDFVALDDYDLIVNKQHILRDLKNIPYIFQTNLLISDSGVYYRPVVMLSFMIDALIGGKDPFMYHLSNIVYHLVASFLLFLLLKSLTENKFKSFLLSLIFSIHPAISQAVSWIPGRNDSLLSLFLSLSLIALIKSQSDDKNNKQILIILSLISFFISLLVKENALLLLLFILLYLIFLNNEKLSYVKILRIFLLYLIPVIIYFILRTKAEIKSLEIENLTISLTDYIKGLINYFGKIFLPINLSVLTLPENINLIYGISTFLIFALLSLNGIHNLKLYVFGILWFLFFSISGMIGLIGFTNFLDHRLYVPIAGILISLSQMRIFDQLKSFIIFIALSICLIFFVYLNLQHTKNFSDPLNFYESASKTSPESFFVHRGLANVYHRMNKYDLAEKHYRLSISLNPNSAETFLNFGINFKKKGMLDSAEFYFIKAIQKNPELSTAYNNLGNLYLQKNLLDRSELNLKQAIRINPNYFEAYNNLGVLYAKKKNDLLAYKYFRKSIDINPFFAEGYFNLALYFFNQNKIDSSSYYYQKAIQLGFPENNILKDKLKK